MPWFPWHPAIEADPPGPSIPILTGQPVKWHSLKEKLAIGSYDPPALFADALGNELEAADIKQGKLAANCWLLSAIACLTEYQDALPVLFADRGRALQEVTKIRVYNKTKATWRVLNVDDVVPCHTRTVKLLCSELVRHRDAPGEAWLPLLEKAFATYVGGYPKLNGGSPSCALEALTGDPVRVFAFDDGKGRWGELAHDADVAKLAAQPHAPPPRVIAQHEHDALWALLRAAYGAGHLIAAGTEGVIQSGQEDRQAYAVVELHDVCGERLLCVRNPWGSFRWKGDWSAESELWDTRPEVTSAVNPVLETDSEFYISFDDLRHSFYQLYICERGTGRNTSLRFLTAAAFTEPPELARQQSAAIAARRAGTKRFYGVASCLPRSRNMITAFGTTTGLMLQRLGNNAGAIVNTCASVSRKAGGGSRAGAPMASSAEAASSLDDDGGGSTAVGAPAADGTVIGRPWAAVAALRSYLRPSGAAGAGAAAVGEPVAAAEGTAAGGTVLGYAVRWGGYSNRPGPVTILRAYWRGEPLPTAADAAAAAAAAAAPAAGGSAAPPSPSAQRGGTELGTPMLGRPAAAAPAAAAPAAAPAAGASGGDEDTALGVPPMPAPPALPVTRPGNMRAPAPAGAAWLPAEDVASGSGSGVTGPATDAAEAAPAGAAAVAEKLENIAL